MLFSKLYKLFYVYTVMVPVFCFQFQKQVNPYPDNIFGCKNLFLQYLN